MYMQPHMYMHDCMYMSGGMQVPDRPWFPMIPNQNARHMGSRMINTLN
jgi:hypothetical protein